MAKNKIQLQSDGIKRALKNYKMYDSLSEYIWNGFDAQATKVEVLFCKNDMDSLEYIIVRDNGYGIAKETLSYKFTPVFESEKTIKHNPNNTSIYHGKNGIGRLTFFTFASHATWSTIYETGNKKHKYTIDIDSSTLEEFTSSEEESTNEDTGTEVTLDNINLDFSIDDLVKYLQTEFSWYIELKRLQGCQLYIDNKLFDNSEILEDRTEHEFRYNDDIKFTVVFCRWSKRLNKEFSKYYYINSNGEEVYKENTTLNNKGDNFFHTVFIKSVLFDNFSFDTGKDQVTLNIYTKDSDEYRYIKCEVEKLIREKRNPFIKQYTKKYLQELKRNGAYPKYEDNLFDNYRKDSLEQLISNIYYAEPKIFSKLNITQQKTFIRLFDLIIQSNNLQSLFDIIDSVVDMSEEERVELSEILDYTNMSNITATIKLLKDRAQSVNYLKELVFNKTLNVTEIKHLQPFIEQNYWLFGEQYHLVTAEEPDFEEALRRFIYILNGEKKAKSDIKMDSPDKIKEMDIFAVRQDRRGTVKKCIVVELKRPSVILSDKELGQIKTYFKTIQNESRFQADNIEWDFFLVGNRINDDIQNAYENASPHGEKFLVYKIKNCKIYVKTWSDIITEFELNHNFLMEHLQLQQKRLMEDKEHTADNILEKQRELSSNMPEEIQI